MLENEKKHPTDQSQM